MYSQITLARRSLAARVGWIPSCKSPMTAAVLAIEWQRILPEVQMGGGEVDIMRMLGSVLPASEEYWISTTSFTPASAMSVQSSLSAFLISISFCLQASPPLEHELCTLGFWMMSLPPPV